MKLNVVHKIVDVSASPQGASLKSGVDSRCYRTRSVIYALQGRMRPADIGLAYVDEAVSPRP